MDNVSFGETGPCRVFRPMIDFYRLDPKVAAWTLVAPCEGEHYRLLLTGTADLPLLLEGESLRCTSVDAPNPVTLEGQSGSLEVQSSDLRIFGREKGFASVSGKVVSQWKAFPPSVGPTRPFTIELALVATVRL